MGDCETAAGQVPVTDHLDPILAELRSAGGVDFSGYRQAVIERRVQERMREIGALELDEYCARLRRDAGERDALVDAIAINVSAFFRNPLCFELVGERLLPGIIDQKEREGTRELRVWSAGCAAGEEAYSLAILICEALGDRLGQWRPLVFATDIDREALAAAREATYPRLRFEHTKLGIVDKYCVAQGGEYQVCSSVRDMVRCSWDDLASDKLAAPAESVFGSFDLIFCRNVLIYFASQLQSMVLGKLCRALCPGGYLVLGPAESLAQAAAVPLNTVDARCQVYRRPS